MTETRISGELFAPDSTRSSGAELLAAGDGTLLLSTDDGGEYLDRGDLALSHRLGTIPRRLTLPDGRVFVTSDHAGVQAAFPEHHGLRIMHLVAESEIFRPRIMAVLVGLFLVALAILRFGLPAAMDAGATLVPPTLEARLGAAAFETFDRLVDESTLPAERRAEVAALFDEVQNAAGLPAPVDLSIRKGGPIGANAFALPGGPVLITDELIELAPDDDALAGVMAHELAHVEHRHGLRRMMRAAGWVILVSVVADEASGLFEEIAGFPTLLIDQSYSRSFETEADDRSIEIMRAAGRNPAALADMLAELTRACGPMCDQQLEWLSSHPAPAGRVERIRERAR